MDELELIKKQMKMAQDLTLRLVSDVDDRFWKLSPQGMDTNINWQVGHIAVALYYHALVCTGGEREALKNVLPMQELIPAYKMGSQPTAHVQGKPAKEELLKALKIIFRQVEVTLNSLTAAELDQPTEEQHPVAKTKREVLSWCSHHQMWHNGTIAVLKRILTGKGF